VRLTHHFLHNLLYYYQIKLHHLASGGILHIAAFVKLCEAFLRSNLTSSMPVRGRSHYQWPEESSCRSGTTCWCSTSVCRWRPPTKGSIGSGSWCRALSYPCRRSPMTPSFPKIPGVGGSTPTNRGSWSRS
jgi:hypothetical protein